MENSGLSLTDVAGLVAAIVVLCIPPYIAFKHQHPNRVGILVLTILLGWTGLGWIVAYIWAAKQDK